jgi:hypothetical protein
MRIVLILSVLCALVSCAEDKPKQNKAWDQVEPEISNEKLAGGYDMDKPEGWLDQSGQSIEENLNRFDIDKGKVEEMVRTHKGMQPVCVYSKYDPVTFYGLIPTIQVNLSPYFEKDYKSFKRSITASILSSKDVLENFKIVDGPKDVMIDGVKSLYFELSFTMSYDDNVSIVTSKTYAIPGDGYFYQVNLTDMEGEKCDDLFDELMSSVKL